ncbi:MAG: four helix bundle protein [archaeon]
MIDINNLKIYVLAKEIEIDIRSLTKKFPKEEKYCLTQQLNRAANSIGANIAEGAGRSTKPDFLRFLSQASGSLKEIIHHLEIAKLEEYVSTGDFILVTIKVNELGRMINAFIKNTKK